MDRPSASRVLLVVTALALGPTPLLAQDLDVTLLVQEGDAITDRPDEFLIVAPQRDELAISQNGRALVSGDVENARGSVVGTRQFALASADGTLTPLIALGARLPDGNGWTATPAHIDRLDLAGFAPSGDATFGVGDDFATGAGGFLATTLTQILEPLVYRDQAPTNGFCRLHVTNEAVRHDEFDVVITMRDATSCTELLNRNRSGRIMGVHASRNGATPTLVVEERQAFPGVTDGRWTGFGSLRVTEDGFAVLRAGHEEAPEGQRATFLGNAIASVDLANGGSPTVIAKAGDSIPGTALTIRDVIDPTVGEVDESGYSVAYFVQAIGGGSPSGDAFFVMDTSLGTPLIGTGTMSGNFTFLGRSNSVRGTSFIRFGDTDQDGVVTFGRTDGPGGITDAVWRSQTVESRTHEVLLVVGETLPVAQPGSRTLSDIFSVNVDGAGAVWAEVETSDGRELLLREIVQGAPTGQFEIAIETFATELPLRDDEIGTVSALVPGFDSVGGTVLGGTGLDGAPSRFDASGEFLFRVELERNSDFTPLQAVYLTGSDEPVISGDVTVKQQGKHLFVTGNDVACAITIETDGDGDLRVRGREGTTINGGRATFELDGLRGDIRIRMGPASDSVRIESQVTAGDEDSVNDIEGSLIIDTGDGSDFVFVEKFQCRRNVSIRTGAAGEVIGTRVELDNCEILGKFGFEGGTGKTTLELDATDVTRPASIWMARGGESNLTLRSGAFGRMKIQGGPNFDQVTLDRCNWSAAPKIDLGAGEVGRVFAEDCTFERGVKIGLSGNFNSRVELRDCDVTAGSLKITATDFAGSLDLNGGTYDGKCVLGVTAADETIPTARLFNVICGAPVSFKLRGSGSFTLAGTTAIDDGVRISATGPGLHDIGFNGLTGSGSASVNSKKGRLEFTANDVQDLDRLLIRTKGPGRDFVSVENTMLGSLLKVSTHLGDDDVSIQGTTVPKAKLDGGKDGDDRLDLGLTTENTIGTDSFKEFEGFEIRPLD